MSTFPAITAQRLIKALRTVGFEVIRKKGSHHFLRHPDGRCTVNPMLKWTLRILGPTCRGRLLWRNNVLASRENLKWLKSDLHVCGIDLGKVSDLNDRVHELLDVKLEVTKRTKGENENVYFNRRIVLDDAPAAGCAGLDPVEIAPF